MAKDAYYFSHDYDPLGDPKMQAMVSEFGGAGYGIFWRIVEMLHAESDHALPFKRFLFIAVAQQMKTTPEFIEKFINSCILDFELFIYVEAKRSTASSTRSNNDDASVASFFASNRVHRNIDGKRSKTKQKSESGKLGGIKSGESRRSKQNEAPLQKIEATVSVASSNEAKERKGKESIESLSKQIPTTTDPPEIGSVVVVAAAKLAWEDQKWREQICMANYFTEKDLRQWMYMYNSSLTSDTMPDFSPSKYKKMFNGWLQAKKNKGYTLPENKNFTGSQLKTIS